MAELIFAVEDEDNIREIIQCTLSSFGYETRTFACAEDMLRETGGERQPDLILLDIMLPGISGLDALKRLKQSPKAAHIPVILLTAKSLETDKVAGLDLGADDYITKPFGILELMARVRAALRRGKTETQSQTLFTYKDLCLDSEKHMVQIEGKEIHLTLKEFELLHILLQNIGKAVSREELLDRVWGLDFEGESRTLDMHIKTLRQKLGDGANEPKYIKTVRGIGYIMV